MKHHPIASLAAAAAMVSFAGTASAGARPAPQTPSATNQTAAITGATFGNLPIETQGFLMYLKFNRALLSDDSLVEWISMLRPGQEMDCRPAVAYRNEFDAAAAISRARAAANRILDQLPPVISATLQFDLGSYDSAQGGFPVGSIHGDGQLHRIGAGIAGLTARAEPPTNVGATFTGCGLFLFGARVQVAFRADAKGTFGMLKMSEADARTYVAAHPNGRKVTAVIPLMVSATHEQPNGWNAGKPAKLYWLDGRYGTPTFRDFMGNRPVPGTLTFSPLNAN